MTAATARMEERKLLDQIVRADPGLSALSAVALTDYFNRVLDAREAAEYLGLSMVTLAKQRCRRGEGPAFLKIGSAIRYQLRDLLVWREQQRRYSRGLPDDARYGETKKAGLRSTQDDEGERGGVCMTCPEARGPTMSARENRDCMSSTPKQKRPRHETLSKTASSITEIAPLSSTAKHSTAPGAVEGPGLCLRLPLSTCAAAGP